MQTLTRRMRHVAAAIAGLAAACALTVPAAVAHAATSYTPNPNEWWIAKWKVPQQVWPVSQGAGVTVGVLDSGVQASNPDLSGVVMSGTDELGEPGNGQKDYAPGGGHGTTVAALVAGQGIGGAPVGLAPKAKILPVHVTDPNSGGGTVIADGIKYAVDHGARVINMSFGGPTDSATSCDSSEQAAVDYALAHNVVVVAAAGDTNTSVGSGPSDPASCPGVLAVGAVEPDGSLWPHSTQAPYVSVAAPGDHIIGVWTSGGISTNASGTSFSAPLVAGAAALIRSKYPSMPWYQVEQRLIDTAIPVGSVPNNGVGYGIIDIAKAIDVSRFPVKASAPNPPYARYQAYLKSTGQSSGSGQGGGAAPSASPKSSKGSSLGIIVAIVVIVVLLAVVALVIVLVTRGRKRRGPRNPGGGGGYPPSPYGHPAARGQYPPPGQQYPQGQYPPPHQ